MATRWFVGGGPGDSYNQKKLPNRPHVYEYQSASIDAFDLIGVAHLYKRSFGQNVRILRPQIDKLTLLIDIFDEEKRQEIFKFILGAVADEGIPEISKIKKGDLGWGAVKNLVYDLKLRIDAGSSGQFATVVVAQKNKAKV